VGGPLAGHFSYRGLEVTDHSASSRAGTVVDGHNQQIVTQYPRRDHRRWSPHMEASRNEQAKPNPSHNGIRVSSGEIGTHAIHPPGKRSIDINKSHFHTETRGWTRRSAATQRFVQWKVNRCVVSYSIYPSTTTTSSATIELQRIVSIKLCI
jgi:hypothetical protein